MLDHCLTSNPLPVSKGKFTESEPFYERALAINEKALGPEHPDMASSLNNLAGLLSSQVISSIIKRMYRNCLKSPARGRAGHGCGILSSKSLSPHILFIAWNCSKANVDAIVEANASRLSAQHVRFCSRRRHKRRPSR